jgi:phospholipase C
MGTLIGVLCLYQTPLRASEQVTTTALPTAIPTSAPTGVSTPGTPLPTVFLIMMENQNWASIKASPSAPYINQTLLPMGAHAEQYYNPPGLHPSEPNYIWLEAGTAYGVSTDADPQYNHIASSMHLVSLLERAGISWKAYVEGIDGTRCPLVSHDLYAVKHNGTLFFEDVTEHNDPQSAHCIAHERPYSELAADLRANSVAYYDLIIPDLCDDMHNICPPTNNSIKNGDNWLAQNLPVIFDSQAYQGYGVVIIAWDEGLAGDGPIGLIVLSPNAKRGYANTIHYTHSSTLRTVEEFFGVTPLLGDAAQATDLSDLFSVFP